jgi:hypothetical protein
VQRLRYLFCVFRGRLRLSRPTKEAARLSVHSTNPTPARTHPARCPSWRGREIQEMDLERVDKVRRHIGAINVAPESKSDSLERLPGSVSHSPTSCGLNRFPRAEKPPWRRSRAALQPNRWCSRHRTPLWIRTQSLTLPQRPGRRACLGRRKSLKHCSPHRPARRRPGRTGRPSWPAGTEAAAGRRQAGPGRPRDHWPKRRLAPAWSDVVAERRVVRRVDVRRGRVGIGLGRIIGRRSRGCAAAHQKPPPRGRGCRDPCRTCRAPERYRATADRFVGRSAPATIAVASGHRRRQQQHPRQPASRVGRARG